MLVRASVCGNFWSLFGSRSGLVACVPVDWLGSACFGSLVKLALVWSGRPGRLFGSSGLGSSGFAILCSVCVDVWASGVPDLSSVPDNSLVSRLLVLSLADVLAVSAWFGSLVRVGLIWSGCPGWLSESSGLGSSGSLVGPRLGPASFVSDVWPSSVWVGSIVRLGLVRSGRLGCLSGSSGPGPSGSVHLPIHSCELS